MARILYNEQMRKNFITFSLILLFFLLIPPAFYFLQSQPIVPRQEKIEYSLPYPGILPDHPLFIFKKFRDMAQEFGTRDSLKKAELYLHLADKRAAMSLSLAKVNKETLSAESYLQAEEYAARIPALLQISREQGVTASSDFILRLKLSNQKHKEVGGTLLRDLSQSASREINKSLEINQEIKKKLEKL